MGIFEFWTHTQTITKLVAKIRAGKSVRSILQCLQREKYTPVQIRKLFSKAIGIYYAQELEILNTTLLENKREGEYIKKMRKLDKKKEALEIELAANP